MARRGSTMARPTVAIRIPGELYDELVEIADERDVTISQSLDIYIRRLRREADVREQESGRADRDKSVGSGNKAGNQAKSSSGSKAKSGAGEKAPKPKKRVIKVIPVFDDKPGEQG